MDLFSRSEPLERVGDTAGEASAPALDRAPRERPSIASIRRAVPIGAQREPATPALEDGGSRLGIVLVASLGAHALAAALLAALPAASSLLGLPETIEIDMAFAVAEPPPLPPPEPEIVPELAPPEPVRVPRERPRAVEPEPAPAEPEPAPAAIGPEPPSLDDVFAPASPPDALAAESGSFGVGGSPGGRPGGVPGGTGDGIGTASRSGAPVATGPSAADVRRARRAYSDAVRELLARHARYPIAARAQRVQGRVVLALRVAEDGRLVAARVAGSSGFSLLDDAALATANDVRTFPRPPSLVPWSPSEEIRVPLVYQITR